MNNKFISITDLVKKLDKLKSEGKTIVTYNGSFDILHEGHIKSIREAKGQGDILCILINTDKSVKLYKGPKRPVNTLEKRIEQLSNLQEVDYIVSFDEITPIEILEKIKPTIHSVGKDWGDNPVEKNVVTDHGGKIHVLKWIEGFSTTKKIEETSKVKDVRAVFIDRDGTINDNKDGYVHDQKDFAFLPGALDALKKLSAADYKIIIVTNQSGIGKGMYSLEQFNTLTAWILGTFATNGIRMDHLYYCPHKDEDHCDCRKPKIGMLTQAVKDFGVNLSKSYVVGNDDRDVEMGRNANAKTIQIGKDVKSLSEAVDMILKETNGKN